MAISMLKIRRPLGRLIFNMGIAIPGKTVFHIETAPWSSLDSCDRNNRHNAHILLHILFYVLHYETNDRYIYCKNTRGTYAGYVDTHADTGNRVWLKIVVTFFYGMIRSRYVWGCATICICSVNFTVSSGTHGECLSDKSDLLVIKVVK